MTNAVITSYNFTGDGTQAGILTQLNTAMIAAGFTLIDSFALTGNEQRVWQFDADPADTQYGKMIVQGGFSATTTMQVRGYSSYNPASDSGLDVNTTATTSGIALNSNFTLHACNHPEIRGVIMIEGTTFEKFFGYIRPANKPPLWGSAPYGFIDSGTTAYVSTALQTISSLRSITVGTAIGAQGYVNNNVPDIAIWSNRPFITNCLLADTTNTRPIAFFSNDVVSVGSFGVPILGQFFDPVTNATYVLFDQPGTAANGARIAVRIS